MSWVAVYDETTGEIIGQVFGSGTTATASAATIGDGAGVAAGVLPIEEPVSAVERFVDVDGEPVLASRPDLALAPTITLSQLTAADLPPAAVVTIEGWSPVSPGPGLDSLAASIAPDGGGYGSRPVTVEAFPYRTYSGTVVTEL